MTMNWLARVRATLSDPVKRRAAARSLLALLRSRAFLLEAASLVAIAGVTAGIAFFVSTRLVVRSADAVTLEDLTGRDAGDAAVWLAAHGLRAEIAHFEDNDRAEPLTVVFQEPPAGEDLRDGMAVRMVISRGARSVPVPDVRASYESQARLILERNGLAVGETLEVYDAGPRGMVLATSPAANASVRGGSPVRLLVSRGPAPRAWRTPELTWSLFDGAQALAAGMGVPLEIGQRLHAEDEAEGVILEQFPAAGTRLVEGHPIRVTVNGDVGKVVPTGAANLVTLSIAVPKGFAMHSLRIHVTRGAWVRTVYEEPVFPGERVRVVAAVLPGDRAVAILDGREVFTRTF